MARQALRIREHRASASSRWAPAPTRATSTCLDLRMSVVAQPRVRCRRRLCSSKRASRGPGRAGQAPTHHRRRTSADDRQALRPRKTDRVRPRRCPKSTASRTEQEQSPRPGWQSDRGRTRHRGPFDPRVLSASRGALLYSFFSIIYCYARKILAS